MLVTYSIQDNIAYVGLNEEKRFNVLSEALVEALNAALQNAQSDNAVKIVVLFGYGRGFCAGGDLREILKIKPDPIKQWEYLYSCQLPVIAAVHGAVVGGGLELMMMTDYVIAAHDTNFIQPELKLGFIPGCGATQRLPSRIGYGAAFDLMATGKSIDAVLAKDLGLINEIVNKDDLLTYAHQKALQWAKRTKEELIYLKQAMRSDYVKERELFYQMVSSPKAKLHIETFLNKS